MATRQTIIVVVHTVAELDDTSLASGYPAMRELRPHLADAAEFVERVRRQRAQGYRLAASLAADGSVAAVAGFWCGENLVLGRHLYVDDLVTVPAQRRRGHAGALLAWLDEEAARLGCTHVHLDSAPHRHAAHRGYFRAGYAIMAFHFAKELP